jgi:hypothetical protein
VVDSDNLRCGRETEAIAREEYANVQSVSVHDSGLVISSSHPWLCGSPDGIVTESDGELIVLEIKCPVSGQTSHINMPYIKDGKLTKSHAYYAQVQVQLFVCDAKVAHFYMYGSQNRQLIVIEQDDKFC